jgi:spore photoproduct lyase
LISSAVIEEETRGQIVRDCPGTPHHVCCGYRTIDLIEGCPLSCSYCVLKGYLNTPGIRVHTDMPLILAQLEAAMDTERAHVPRFGTGELSDSLALDRCLGFNRPLAEFFGQKRKGLLELKSKWASIDHLQGVLNPYTVVSFSLAPPRIVEQEETRTSPLHKRLKTLKKAQDWGSFVGIHFDPIIVYPGFEKDYEYLIDDVARIVDLERVLWVSMGCLRFPPRLFDLFLKEGRSTLLHGEFVRGEDGKYRYLKQERIRVYRLLYDRLKAKEKGLFMYFCMERPDVWEAVTGTRVNESEELIGLFDERIHQCYGGAL